MKSEILRVLLVALAIIAGLAFVPMAGAGVVAESVPVQAAEVCVPVQVTQPQAVVVQSPTVAVQVAQPVAVQQVQAGERRLTFRERRQRVRELRELNRAARVATLTTAPQRAVSTQCLGQTD